MLKSISRFFSTTSAKTPSALKPGLPIKFDPRKSKYSGSNETNNLKTKIERKDAPAYLKNEQTFQDEVKQSYELENVETVK